MQFILQRDRAGVFRFASLQSERGRALLVEHGLDPDQLDTVVLIEDGRAYLRSDVPLRVAPRLDGPWGWVSAFRVLPRGVRDRIYEWVAANRYRWFGKREECMLPRPEWTNRFLY